MNFHRRLSFQVCLAVCFALAMPAYAQGVLGLPAPKKQENVWNTCLVCAHADVSVRRAANSMSLWYGTNLSFRPESSWKSGWATYWSVSAALQHGLKGAELMLNFHQVFDQEFTRIGREDVLTLSAGAGILPAQEDPRNWTLSSITGQDWTKELENHVFPWFRIGYHRSQKFSPRGDWGIRMGGHMGVLLFGDFRSANVSELGIASTGPVEIGLDLGFFRGF